MRKLVLLLAVVGVVSCADQTTKYHAVGSLTSAFAEAPELTERIGRFVTESHPRPVRAISVVDGFWDFRYVENPGGFWSSFRSLSADVRLPLLLALGLVMMTVLAVVYLRTPRERLLHRFALALALGGALGNFVDRARFGYVIDFIDWHWQRVATWPTFNVADAAITVGVGLLLFESFRRERQRAS